MSSHHVSPANLETIKCSFCDSYLSHLPIHVYPNGKVSCGRCPLLVDEQPLRSRASEVVAAHIHFPCVNKKFGCVERKTAVDMPSHEQFCIYKQHSCPMAFLGPCSWQGYLRNLFLHYALHHSIYLLKSADFKLNLLIDFEHNYLLKHEEELFVVRAKFDAERTLTCSLSHLSKIKSDEIFYYTITLSDGPKLNSFKFNTLQIEDDAIVTIDRNSLKFFKDPEVFCEIRISTEPNKAVSSSEEPIRATHPSGPSALKCSNCKTYMAAPIYMCCSKHGLCVSCKTKGTPRCPICSSRITPFRNLSLEKLINYCCKYAKYGCTIFAAQEEILKHETACGWRTRKCPLKNINLCLWKGPKGQLLKHVWIHHSDNLFKSDELIWSKAVRKVFVVPFDEQIFIFTFRFYSSTFYWNLKMNGSAAEAEKYAFELSFLNGNGKEVGTCLRQNAGHIGEERDPFKIDHFLIKIPFKFVSHLMSNQKLVYTLSIVKK